MNRKSRFVALFSGQEFQPEVFSDSSALALFGGIDMFAADAVIPADCTIRATALFGGVDLHLPDSANVQIKSFALFGGVGNKRKALPPLNGAPTITVRAFALFGGVDIL